MARARSTRSSNSNSANIGFEQKLWLAADKLRSNMDAAEYKHVVQGLIFLKYISDSFEKHHAKLLAGEGEYAGANPEDPDEYRAENIFWVPPAARWSYLQNSAKQPTIGKIVDDAMVAIERDNPRLKGILPKDYARPALDKNRLGELIDLIGTIGLGEKADRSKDILGRVYEYFLSQFASAEGKKGGQFYTPQSVVRLLVEMLAPSKGRVYDPCCGSGGMFVQSEKFVEAHGGRLGDISIYGQESNATTRRLAMMNLAIRGIEADLGEEQADSFRRDLHPDLRADFVLANPPFNDSDWFRKDDDPRWQFGLPPRGNANFAWVQHFIYHLAPTGIAGFVLANGALSATGPQGEIKRAIVEADMVDSIVMLPPKLFYATQAPVSLWLLSRDKACKKSSGRPRPKETLFIDARKHFEKVGPTRNALADNHIILIANTYQSWKAPEDHSYRDIIGFCRSIRSDSIAAADYSLVPARHVGINVEKSDADITRKNLRATLDSIMSNLGQMEDLADSVRASILSAI